MDYDEHTQPDSIDPASPELIAALGAWMPAQRWFAGKGRTVTEIAVEADRPVDERLRHLLVRVGYAEGPADRYQVPITVRDEASAEFESARVGEVDGRQVYDGLHTPEGTAALLDALREGRTIGDLTAASVRPLEELPGMPVGVEQSNTSVVYGDAYILKVFRRISPGTNPDLELTRALAHAGSEHIAPPLGWLEGPLDGIDTTFAVLQEFLRSGTEGWRMALASVRDLYAEGDLHADEVGGDFAGESERLGAATAQVHDTLASVLPSRLAEPGELAAAAAGMAERLAEAIAAAPALAPYEAGLRAAFAALAEYSAPVSVQRIHGDYHLGQVLRVDSGWVLLDFEGEPARPLADRVKPGSPLRDVAGMLRSFDYAARYLLLDRHDAASLAYRAEEWAERNKAAFCAGYAAASGTDPRDEDVVLSAFELDKAVYEVMYEARHRPSWVSIPLAAISKRVG